MPTSASSVYTTAGELELRTPFDPRYVEELKETIPSHARQFCGTRKAWIIDLPYQDHALEIFDYYFPKGTLTDHRKTSSRRDDAPPRPQASPSVASPYRILFVTEDAPTEVVIAAYRALSKLHHPDRGGDLTAMQELNRAYELVSAEVA